MRVRPLPVLLLAVVAMVSPRTARADASESALELVREAHEHEAAQEDLLAVRRYAEALALDPTLGDAYLGLGALRLRGGDPREAERVFDVALARIPELHRALLGRSEARMALGLEGAAEADLDEYVREAGDPAALRELADHYAHESRAPAQLAIWRKIRALTSERGDTPLARQALTMVRALQILVGGADPVTRPTADDPTRRGIARVAARGG